jgi:predicted AlkP superfamily phosphohydrolase/phosphomutase
MIRRRFLLLSLFLLGIAGLLYLMISLYIPSARRMTLGVDKRTGRVRTVENHVTFLPPHRFYRLVFDVRDDAAQRDGIINIRSREGVPVRMTWRIRFRVSEQGITEPKRLVEQGWSAWIRARIGESVSAVTQRVPIEDLISPVSDFTARRDRLREVVVRHLAQSGLEVTAFEILSVEADREALLEFKRAELRRNARGYQGQVVVISIDGADWDLVGELITGQRLPNLGAILQRGATGRIQTLQPTVSPLLYAAMATGLPPDRTGVVDFTDRLSGALAVDSRSRRVPAIWDIAGAFGRTSGVVNWWTAWPPTTTQGIFFGQPLQSNSEAFPPEFTPRALEVVIPEETVGYAHVARFLNVSAAEYERAVAGGDPNDPIVAFRSVLARSWTDHRVAIEAFRTTSPNLFMMHYGGTEFVNHLFGPYHPPYRNGVPADEFRKFAPAVANFYADVDRMIGEWMRVIPREATVLFVSAHGMAWGQTRPRRRPSGETSLGDHRPFGILLAYGERVVPSRTYRVVSIYDIAPTVLTLLGLPKSQEMPGAFISPFFRDVEPIEQVAIGSYGDFIESRPVIVPQNPDVDQYRAHLLLTGHLAPESRQSPLLEDDAPQSTPVSPEVWGRYAWLNNRAIELKGEGNDKEAIEALQEAVKLNPTRPTPYFNLSIMLFDREMYTASEQHLMEAIRRGLPNPEQHLVDYAAFLRSRDMPSRAASVLSKGLELFPDSYLLTANLASALSAVNRFTDALPLYERALALRPTSTLVLNDLGILYMRRKEYARALDYWNRSLALDPRQPEIRQAVNAIQTRI